VAVYIANFGIQNYEWPECLRRGTIATMNDFDVFDYWKSGNRQAYTDIVMSRKTAARKTPTKAVASRWFNLMTIVDQSAGDIWIHRDGAYLWWTRSKDEPSVFYERVEPVSSGNRVIVCHKPCEPWRKTSELGAGIFWDALHPKAKDFLSTEATLQQLSPGYAAYAMALIRGGDLSAWETLPVWKAKASASKGQSTGVRVYSGMQRAVWRMADTAFNTVAQANGQQTMKTVKNKDCVFSSKEALQAHIRDLLEMQEHQCAITGLRLNYDDPDEDPELKASLDRIDSNGHYAEGNLQVVSAFINKWKGASDNDQFKRLIDMLMTR